MTSTTLLIFQTLSAMKKSITLIVLSSLTFASSASACFDKATYYGIDKDVEAIASSLDNEDDLIHFYGGIVRMVAHDFMDYDRNSDTPMGSDGCIDWGHDANRGFWGSIWCDGCDLTKVYHEKYGHLSKADFWIASANAVIRNLSVDKSLDLVDTFLWGRRDADSCQGQGDRIPMGSGCREVQDVFLDAMGLTWRDSVALLGAHTIGKAHSEFSGHDGYWMPSGQEALVFDKQYYEELVMRPWRARNIGKEEEDFIASTEMTHQEPQMMLKTDLCFWFDTDNHYPCCTRTNRWMDGQNWCDWEEKLSDLKCTRYDSDSSRMEAVESVVEFLGGRRPNENNDPFYQAFSTAWFKATTNGHGDLKALRGECW
ncbi:hypothetical protein HJC23_004691 [Cyclotella cryptica]|uniref:Plant heme peroxidase family profile domain-containing protein n=1 Tax=Cyclotella cryptica TaxID=29204 RepID=A0ABD3PKS0_9STRA|eukprot:CCRYP_013907-RA/>CCRYP_013907-RA protein AED:0.02 eAED:0.02 QI:464/1/1/1/1/1/2/304/369